MARRANGEGSIYKRKSDNRWTGKVQVGFYQNGTPKYRVVYGQSQKEVKDKLDELKASVKNNSFVEPSRVTLGEWLDNWLNVTIKTFVKDTTWLIYESLIRNHLKELGGVKLSQIKASHIQKFYNDKLEGGRLDGKEGGLSAMTIKHMHKVLTSAFKQAVAEKMIASNIMDAVKAPKLTHNEMKTLDENQVRIFLDKVKKHVHYKRYYAPFLLELFTGARRGELLALRYKDVDEKNCTIKFVQQLVKVGSKHVIRELKTNSSQNRVIVVPAEVIEALKEYKQLRKREYEEVGYNDLEIKEMTTNGLIFTNELGGYIQPRNFTRAFKCALKIAGLPDIRFHDMRHTFAMLSLQQGVDIKTLQSDLGHRDSSTTLDKYGHVNKDMKSMASEKRSEILKRKINGD